MDGKQKTVLVWGAIIVGGIAVVSWLVSRFTNFNKGTPFEGAGAVGTLGNVTNQVLGGAPQAIGESLSETLFELTHDDFDGTTYLFTFKATGVKSAVNSGDVDKRGFFTWFRDGQRYQLLKDADGRKWAIKV